MLIQKPTEEMIKEWKEIYNQYKDTIQPNKKDGTDIIMYLENNYPVTEIEDDEFENIVADNIKNNEHSKSKLRGENPIIRIFKVNNSARGMNLYKQQDEIFKNIEIIVGIELKTSYIFVEGSSYLYDELIAFTGLDSEDIKNYFLVAQYIKCKEKFNI